MMCAQSMAWKLDLGFAASHGITRHKARQAQAQDIKSATSLLFESVDLP
jgi:hypothetical protein